MNENVLVLRKIQQENPSELNQKLKAENVNKRLQEFRVIILFWESLCHKITET